MTTDRPVIVFDFGGVLTHPVRASIEAWMARDRIEPASLTRVLRAWLSREAEPDNPLHRLERGELDVARFSIEMAARLSRVDGGTVEPEGLLDRFFGGLELDQQMIELVRELRAAGARTVLLSNSWGNDYPWALLEELFEISVISSEVGLRKPQPEIFQLTAQRAGATLEQLHFIDDGEPNIVGAEALGIVSHLHRDHASTRAHLAEAFPGLLRD